ncbi:MAG TPA: NAD(P)/FAD-dependent oxidoreductase [Thermoanaerobaculia bacterium]|nr:NAD(P)/FAD-dependent oxidoreductase [Thermoanaerobaculia bacterium]
MSDRYDVVIVGGAFSGASAAILLRRELPDLRVLIVEKAEAFDEKVGEATTEMSAMFLTRRLAMWQHLENEHLPKEGLRYWFSNDKVTGHANASETGGLIRSTVPAFQLRRDALDEHLLATAVREGAELLRPARVGNVTLGDFDHRVTIEANGETREVACRWILDASGRASLLGRKLGLIERNDEHPTAAMWCRWKNVRHIDDLAVRIGIAGGNVGSRRLGTNHYTGYGYWIWVIPLGNGETSIGVVFDKRLVDLHQSKNRAEDFLAFLKAIPSLGELLDGAEPRLDDLRFYSHLAYATKQYMGRGWSLLGDAAAFLDPYYSPGLDHASFTVEATVEIIRMQAMGKDVTAAIAEHNETFLRSYWRFFRAVYKDKYYYMGEGDLLSASMLIDTAQYYIFVVIPAYRFMKKFFWMPVLGPKPAFLSYHMMRTYNLRFKAIAEKRRATGNAGLHNDGRRIAAYFNLGIAPARMVMRGLKLWMKAEAGALTMRRRRATARPETPASPSPAHPPASSR